MQGKKRTTLRCDTSGEQTLAYASNTPTQKQPARNEVKKKPQQEPSSSGSKKSSKLIEKSPIKKSSKSLIKRNGGGDQEDSDSIQQPGNQKYIRKISDESFKLIPHIPDHEIEVFMVPEDLTEIERIKVLLNKECQDQKTYFFNNVENIFFINKPEYQNIYGPEYNLEKYRKKAKRHNYETQPYFQSNDKPEAPNDQSAATVVDTEPSEEGSQSRHQQQRQQNNKSQSDQENKTTEDTQETERQNKDTNLQSMQESVQDQIFPLIFGKWLTSQSEYVQILAGESMLLLLKNSQFTFKDEYLISLKKDALLMIDQWSTDVVEIWIEVYAIVLKQIIKRNVKDGDLTIEDFREECRKVVRKMTDPKQMCKVRMKGTSLMGLLAQHDSLGSSQLYEKYWLANLHNICDDFHWEEINYLLDDEEGEVATEAIVSFQKHLTEVFGKEFTQSEEAATMFEKLCGLAEDCDATLVNLGIVMQKLGKIIIAFDKPHDVDFLPNLLKLINKAKDSLFDEEIRAMLPLCFEAICQIYSKNMRLLIDMYETKFKVFIKCEIEAGIPQDKKAEKQTLPKSIYSDIIEKEISKYHRKVYKDKNFIINRSIAQNLHFFFGAFISVYSESYQRIERLKAVPLPTELIDNCLLAVLQSYLKLVKTKDRELLHYVLFSFKSYHDHMTKVDIWLQIPEPIRELYMEIISNIKQCEEVVKCSWRYHITYLKVVETIVDSNADYNDEMAIKMVSERPDKDSSLQPQIKAFNTMINAERKELLKSLQGLVLDRRSADAKIHEKKTSQQAKLYAIKVLAKQMTTNKQQKFRQSITEFFAKLAKQKDSSNRQAYIELVTVLINEKLVSSKTFQQTYFDHLMQILDDAKVVRFQQKILKEMLPGVYKLVQNSRNHIDKLLSSLKYLKQKTEQSLLKPDKLQPIPQELMNDIDSFVTLLQDPDFQCQAVEFLQTTDHDLLKHENELQGFVANEGTLTNRRGSDNRSNLMVLGERQVAANKNKDKKSISVRSGSKTGLRSTHATFMNQDKQENHQNAANKPEVPTKRLKSMRPPSHNGIRKSQPANQVNVALKNQEYQSSKIGVRLSPNSTRRVMKNRNNSNQMIDSQFGRLIHPNDDSCLGQNKENAGMHRIENSRNVVKNRAIASSHSRTREDEVSGASSEANSHSEKITKGKVSMIEPQIIQGISGDPATNSSSRLPPRAAAAAKKRENQSTAQSDSIAQYRSQKDNYAYVSSIDSGALQIEKRESHINLKEEVKHDEPQTRSEHIPGRSNNGSLLNNRKPGKGYHTGAPLNKLERAAAAAEYNKQYQIQLNKHISRKSNLTTAEQTPIQILDSSPTEVSFPSYNPDIRQLTKHQYDAKALIMNSKSSQNAQIKYMHLRNNRTNQISNDKQKQIHNISDQVNDLCVNQTNEVPFIANSKNIERIIQKAQNSISPNNNRFQSNIPPIPQLPVPRSTDMARKSSQGFISLSNNPSQHNLMTSDKVGHLPDVRLSRKSLINNHQQALQMPPIQYGGHASVSPPNNLENITKNMDNPFPQHRALQGLRGGALAHSKPQSQHKVVRRSSQALKRNNHLGLTANQILKNKQ